VACFSANSALQSVTSWIFWAYVVKNQARLAGDTNPQLLNITAQVWLMISAGWLAAIFLSFLSIPSAYVAWVLFPNLVAVWGNHRRQYLIHS